MRLSAVTPELEIEVRALAVFLLSLIAFLLLQGNAEQRQRETARIDREEAAAKVDAKVRDYYREVK